VVVAGEKDVIVAVMGKSRVRDRVSWSWVVKRTIVIVLVDVIHAPSAQNPWRRSHPEN
jgi:hypothetical protein